MNAHHPDDLWPHRASQQFGSDTVVSSGRQRLARIVEKGCDNKLGISAGTFGSCCSLERMLVVVEGQAAVAALQRSKQRQCDVCT